MWYTEEYIKKKRKSSVIVMTTVTADYPGREEPHGTHESAGPNLLSMATGKWQGTAWQEPHVEQGHAVPQPPLPWPGSAACQCWKLWSPKHFSSTLALQQAFTNKSKEAINTCIFSGACAVNTKIVKAELSCQHPAQCWLWCWARSSSVAQNQVTVIALKINSTWTYGWK